MFGRRIYHLNAFQRTRVSSTAEETAIERKTDSRIKTLSVLGVLDYWRDAYRTFVSEIQSATFKGVVVDYDGTLCGEADRFGKLQPAILNELARVARAGCPVGIATGRGKSVWEALRGGLPQSYWNLVAIGYYNGGDIRLLSEDKPDGTPKTAESLVPIAEALCSNRLVADLATIELRIPQITVRPNAKRAGRSCVGHRRTYDSGAPRAWHVNAPFEPFYRYPCAGGRQASSGP